MAELVEHEAWPNSHKGNAEQDSEGGESETARPEYREPAHVGQREGNPQGEPRDQDVPDLDARENSCLPRGLIGRGAGSLPAEGRLGWRRDGPFLSEVPLALVGFREPVVRAEGAAAVVADER